jgi:hypothetical protein
MPYWEQQVGGNCRTHALNAFYGRHEITPEMFAKYCQEYDAYMFRKFGTKGSAMDFDAVNNDQQSVVAYILGRHRPVVPRQGDAQHKKWRPVICKYKAVGQAGQPGQADPYGLPFLMGNPPVSKFVFLFNAGHIWGAKWVAGAGVGAGANSWYMLDSLSGERQISLEELVSLCGADGRSSAIGSMITLEDASAVEKEWRDQVGVIRKLVGAGDVRANAVAILSRLNHEKKVLGDLEIPLGVAMNIIELHIGQLTAPKAKEFVRVTTLYKKYAAFVREAHRWNDLRFILSTLPDILAGLLSL